MNLLNEEIIAFLSIPEVIILFQQVGETAFDLFGLLQKFRFDKISFVLRVLIEFLSGLIILFTIALFLSNLPIPWSFDSFIFIVLFLMLFRSLCFTLFRHEQTNLTSFYFELRRCFGSLYVISVVLLIGIVSGSLLYSFMPYPITIDPSSSAYTFVALQIRYGNSFSIGIGHMPIIPFIVAVGSSLVNVHPLGIMHAAPLFIHILFSVAVYLLAYKVYKRTMSSIAASIFAVSMSVNSVNNFDSKPIILVLFPLWICLLCEQFSVNQKISGAELMSNIAISGIIETILSFQDFFLPVITKSIIFFILVILILLITIGSRDNFCKQVFLTTVLLTMIISMLNSFEAIIVLIVVYNAIITFWAISTNSRLLMLIYIFLIFVPVFIFLQLGGILRFETNFIFSRFVFGTLYVGKWFDMDAAQKFAWLIESMVPIALLLSIFGLTISILQRKKDVFPTTVSLFTLYFLLFLPEGHFWRTIDYIMCFSAIMIAFALDFLWRYVLRSFLGMNRLMIKPVIRKRLYSVCLFLTVIVLIPTFITPRLNFESSIKQLNSEGLLSYFQTYDIKASEWIWSNTSKSWLRSLWWTGEAYNVNKIKVILTDPTLMKTRELNVPLTNDTLIISDPLTMYLLQGFTGRDIAVDERVFIYENEYAKEALQQMEQIRLIFLSGSSQSAYERIKNISRNHTEVLIVFSERTYAWLHSESHFIFFAPTVTGLTFPSIFADPRFFELSLSSDKLFIFRVRNKPLDLISTNPMVIVDDNQSSFWSYASFWNGNICLIISDNNKSFVSGQNMLSLIVSNGTRGSWSLEHIYEQPQDWSKWRYLAFWWMGNNTNTEFRVILFGGLSYDVEAWVDYRFRDDFSGWRLILLNIDLPNSVGKQRIDLQCIWKIIITPTFANMTTGCFGIDKIWLDNFTFR